MVVAATFFFSSATNHREGRLCVCVCVCECISWFVIGMMLYVRFFGRKTHHHRRKVVVATVLQPSAATNHRVRWWCTLMCEWIAI